MLCQTNQRFPLKPQSDIGIARALGLKPRKRPRSASRQMRISERKAIDGAIRYEQPKPKTPIPPELMAGLLIASAAARARK